MSEESTIIEKTAEVGVSVDNILVQKPDIVALLTSGVPERKLLLKEIMITAYIGGFFAGVQHAGRDAERSQS